MSHLRPIDPNDPSKTKAYKDYTDDEKISAIAQMEDGSKTAAFLGKTTSQSTIDLANSFAKGTAKEGNVVIEQPVKPVATK